MEMRNEMENATVGIFKNLIPVIQVASLIMLLTTFTLLRPSLAAASALSPWQ